MATTSQTCSFPIDSDKTYNVPKKFSPRKKKQRRSGSIPCTQEAMDRWLSHGPLPDKETTQKIDALYRQSRIEVDDYCRINWANTVIETGPTDALDKKVLLQSVSGISKSIEYFKHAYCQNNFKITNIQVSESEESRLLSILQNYCHIIQYASWSSKDNLEAIRAQVINSRVLGVRMVDIMERNANFEVEYIKFVRVLLGLPSSIPSKIRSVDFTPNAATDLQIVLLKNQVGVPYHVIEGDEKIYFKTDYCRGQFSHNGEMINSIGCNVSSKDEVTTVLAAIGVYCKLGFRENNAQSLKLMQDQVFEELRLKPWIVIRCEESKWMRLDTMKEDKLALLHIKQQDMDFEDSTIMSRGFACEFKSIGHGVLQIDEVPKPNKPLSTLVEMPQGPLDNYLAANI